MDDRNPALTAKPLESGYELTWYTIRSILGQGGFGITYLAHDSNLDRDVAIKEYFPTDSIFRDADYSLKPLSGEFTNDYATGLANFMSEAKTLAKFNHDSIVRVHSVFEANHTAYMVMEYEHGDSLSTVFRQQAPVSQLFLEDLFFPIIDGLEKIHEQGFIHRDIKPSNIYLRNNGTAVLLDFGSAREAAQQDSRELTALVSQGYTPLEQYSANYGAQGPWTDIYSLAATMFHGLTANKPDDGVSRLALQMHTKADPIDQLNTENYPAFDQKFLDAIKCGLQLRIEERPESLLEWRDQFTNSASSSQTTRTSHPPEDDFTRVIPKNNPPPFFDEDNQDEINNTRKPQTPPPARPPEPAKKSSAGLIAAAVAACLLAVGGFIFFKQSSTEPDAAMNNPQSSKPVDEGIPAKVAPVEVTTAEVNPVAVTPAETTTAEVNPVAVTPAEATTVEVNPVAVTTAEATTAEVNPVAVTPAGTTTAVASPVEVTPAEATTAEATTVEVIPAETETAQVAETKSGGTMIIFDQPLVTDNHVNGSRSIQQLAKGSPIFPPIEGLPEELWSDQECSNCHEWSRDNLCTQGKHYVGGSGDLTSRIKHPYGGFFKQALKDWASTDCR